MVQHTPSSFIETKRAFDFYNALPYTPPMRSYVAYFRVSTDKQGRSGLGLDAQRSAVREFVARHGDLVAEFTEVESSRNYRPELHAALELCRRKKAILLIARLDRLARNVAFISNLMESRVDFVAVDMPEANRLTIHILAAVAEYERDAISERTRAALAAAKQRGVKLGNPTPLAASQKAVAVHQERAREFRVKVKPIIHELHKQGLNLAGIAQELNRRAIPTARNAAWYATTVRNMLKCP